MLLFLAEALHCPFVCFCIQIKCFVCTLEAYSYINAEQCPQMHFEQKIWLHSTDTKHTAGGHADYCLRGWGNFLV